MRLQPPDSLSVILIWIAAIFMGVKEGFDQITPVGHKPVINLDGVWAFAPMALLIVAALIQIFKGSGAGAASAPAAAQPHPMSRLDDESYATFMFMRGLAIFIIVMVVLAILAAHWPLPTAAQSAPSSTAATNQQAK
jgi:hypothetical protein